MISSNLVAIKASGRSDLYMRLEMVRRVVMLLILIVSVFAFHSVEAIAIGYCISTWVDAIISMIPAKRLLGYGIMKQFADLWKTIMCAVIMFVVVQSMNLLDWNIWLLLTSQVG